MGPTFAVTDQGLGPITQGVIDGGHEVPNMYGALGGLGPVAVACPVDWATADTPTRQHRAIDAAPMITAGVFVDPGRAPELAGPRDKGFVQ